MNIIRKITADESGELTSVYELTDIDYAPGQGHRINDTHAAVHADMMNNFEELRHVYKYDPGTHTLIKHNIAKYQEYNSTAIQSDLSAFPEIPADFLI